MVTEHVWVPGIGAPWVCLFATCLIKSEDELACMYLVLCYLSLDYYTVLKILDLTPLCLVKICFISA